MTTKYCGNVGDLGAFTMENFCIPQRPSERCSHVAVTLHHCQVFTELQQIVFVKLESVCGKMVKCG